jgi:hypothetical protein
MNSRRWCVLSVLLLLVSSSSAAAQDTICRDLVPRNIDAGLLTPDAITLLAQSPTFRAQCERIAATPWVRVTLAMTTGLGEARARTTIFRFSAGALRAEVVLQFGQDYRELLAHEFEHVLEQLDGIDLRLEAQHGRAWLLGSGAFETRRASEAGRRARRECELSDAHAVVAIHGLR